MTKDDLDRARERWLALKVVADDAHERCYELDRDAGHARAVYERMKRELIEESRDKWLIELVTNEMSHEET